MTITNITNTYGSTPVAAVNPVNTTNDPTTDTLEACSLINLIFLLTAQKAAGVDVDGLDEALNKLNSLKNSITDPTILGDVNNVLKSFSSDGNPPYIETQTTETALIALFNHPSNPTTDVLNWLETSQLSSDSDVAKGFAQSLALLAQCSSSAYGAGYAGLNFFNNILGKNGGMLNGEQAMCNFLAAGAMSYGIPISTLQEILPAKNSNYFFYCTFFDDFKSNYSTWTPPINPVTKQPIPPEEVAYQDWQILKHYM